MLDAFFEKARTYWAVTLSIAIIGSTAALAINWKGDGLKGFLADYRTDDADAAWLVVIASSLVAVVVLAAGIGAIAHRRKLRLSAAALREEQRVRQLVASELETAWPFQRRVDAIKTYAQCDVAWAVVGPSRPHLSFSVAITNPAPFPITATVTGVRLWVHPQGDAITLPAPRLLELAPNQRFITTFDVRLPEDVVLLLQREYLGSDDERIHPRHDYETGLDLLAAERTTGLYFVIGGRCWLRVRLALSDA